MTKPAPLAESRFTHMSYNCVMLKKILGHTWCTHKHLTSSHMKASVEVGPHRGVSAGGIVNFATRARKVAMRCLSTLTYALVKGAVLEMLAALTASNA